MRLCAAIILLVTGCSPILEHAKRRNPGCDVELLESNSTMIKVLVTCPRKEPKVEEYKQQ